MGEGKVLQDNFCENRVFRGASYGCKDFRAPEIRGDRGWSSSADVFAFGVLLCRTLELRQHICKEKQPDTTIFTRRTSSGDLEQEEVKNKTWDDLSMPDTLALIIRASLQRDPDKRPDAKTICQNLNKLEATFSSFAYWLYGPPIWTELDWRDILASANKHERKMPGNNITNTDDFLDNEVS